MKIPFVLSEELTINSCHVLYIRHGKTGLPRDSIGAFFFFVGGGGYGTRKTGGPYSAVLFCDFTRNIHFDLM